MSKRLIYEEDAIEALKELTAKEEAYIDPFESVFKMLEDLPTVHPEIIRCRDCKHMQKDEIFHQCWCNGNEVKENHFCGYAERRQE